VEGNRVLLAGGSIPDVGNNENFARRSFSMEKEEVSELVEAAEKFYVFQVKDKKPSVLLR